MAGRKPLSAKTVKKLFALSGNVCAFPDCHEPIVDNSGVVVGEICHIKGYKPNSARYDPNQDDAERQAFENLMLMCGRHNKVVDDDKHNYSVQWLTTAKAAHEAKNQNGVAPSRDVVQQLLASADIELIRFYSQCFDRPAFQDAFAREEELLSHFDKAMEDTITAINTGTLRARDRVILGQSKGKSFLVNRQWRDKMDAIVQLLRAIRRRYATLPKRPRHSPEFPQTARWMDETRNEILIAFNEICDEAGIPRLRIHW